MLDIAFKEIASALCENPECGVVFIKGESQGWDKYKDDLRLVKFTDEADKQLNQHNFKVFLLSKALVSYCFSEHQYVRHAEQNVYLFSQYKRLCQIVCPDKSDEMEIIFKEGFCKRANEIRAQITKELNSLMPGVGFYFKNDALISEVQDLKGAFPLSRIFEQSLTNRDRVDIAIHKLVDLLYRSIVVAPVNFLTCLSSTFMPEPSPKPCMLSVATTVISELEKEGIKHSKRSR